MNYGFRWLLAPLAGLYAIGLRIRHMLYDEHVIPSFSMRIPTICVGNLAVGGTGKTPHVEYLVSLLSKEYKVAVLSRGYGRKTRGFLIADENSTAQTIGDEPMQLHLRYPELTVVVCENRVRAVRRLEKLIPDLDVVILDDALQHRAIRPGFSVLLTEYKHLYVDDMLMPVGRLRDIKSRARKADVVVVTKCPVEMKPIDRRVVSNQLQLFAFQQLYFSTIQYAPLPHTGCPLVVTGIARPEPMLEYVRSMQPSAGHLAFNDHHVFTQHDIERILNEAQHYDYVLTTDKDRVRMAGTELESALGDKLYTLPITMHPDEDFDRVMLRYVAESKRKNQLPQNRVKIR